jgi:hypothetical protein
MSDLEQAIGRLEAHERECSIRYEMIQMQLDEHNKRFDRLEALMARGFGMVAIMITLAIAILEFAR